MTDEAGSQREDVVSLEKQIEELSRLVPDDNTAQELERLQHRLEKLRREVFAKLTPWQKLQIARHPQRPHFLDYVPLIFEDFSELHGDRRFEDDSALVAGMARFHGSPCLALGTQKGRDTRQKLLRNFGMPKPEGYRKAMRLMKLAEKYSRPVFSFIDTSGAFPGIGAEERGQAEAIAYNLREMTRLRIPIIVVITGEGGSGGALGIGIGDRIYMTEHSYYSVISPEGCAAILWKDQAKAETAANALKFTAVDLKGFNVVDGVIPEPLGGAHVDYKQAASLIDQQLQKAILELKSLSPEELIAQRYDKFRTFGAFFEASGTMTVRDR